jgi:hypothetical protein
MNAKTKTEMEEEIVADTQVGEDKGIVWLTVKDLAPERNARRREFRKVLNIIVKHNTPIEQVCMQTPLFRAVEDALSATNVLYIMGRLGNCEPAKLRAGDILPQDMLTLYENVKRAYVEGTLSLESVAELTEKGVKMDKYAFSFYVVKE